MDGRGSWTGGGVGCLEVGGSCSAKQFNKSVNTAFRLLLSIIDCRYWPVLHSMLSSFMVGGSFVRSFVVSVGRVVVG